MKTQKLYLNRMYDQWKGKRLYVEDEIDGLYGVYVCMPDAKIDRGSVNSIFADFKDKYNATYSVGCSIEDYNKNLFKFMMPSAILSNDGLYEVVFSISYNSNGTPNELVKTAIQTFSIIDTIEIDDEIIKQETHYPLLIQLIDDIAQYKVDTSSFPTFEDVSALIKENQENQTTIEIGIIVDKINEAGYIKKDYMENFVSTYYLSKFDSANFVTSSALNSYVKNITFTSTLSNYALSSSLQNYVLRETGKGLSTHDFTDELYNKLINLSNNSTGGGVIGGDVILSPSYDELKDIIESKPDMADIKKLIDESYDEAISKLDNYYTKEETDEKFALKTELIKPIDSYTKEETDEKFALKTELGVPSDITVDDIIYNQGGFATLGDYLADLNYVYPNINSFVIYPSKTVYEKGVDSISNLMLSWSINKAITSLSLTDFSTLTLTQTSATYTSLISDTKTFTLTISDGKNTARSSKTINFVYPFYYGTTNEDNIDSVIITENGNKIIETKGQKTLTFTYSDSRVFFAYPSTYGTLNNIKDNNGFSYNASFTRNQITINGVSYYVYVSNTKASAQGILYDFIF